jgi:uncharacterized cupredoxin-like copper-binding protein
MNILPRRSRAASAALLTVILLGACGGGPAAPTGPAMTPSGDVIELTMTGSLQITDGDRKVDAIRVEQGKTYTFRITNSAGFAHDFHIGSDADLAANMHDLPGLGEYSNGTQEFSYTFAAAGPLMFGCTVPGHYGSMKGTFDIQP